MTAREAEAAERIYVNVARYTELYHNMKSSPLSDLYKPAWASGMDFRTAAILCPYCGEVLIGPRKWSDENREEEDNG